MSLQLGGEEKITFLPDSLTNFPKAPNSPLMGYQALEQAAREVFESPALEVLKRWLDGMLRDMV